MADREEVGQQFVEPFEGADYPVDSPMDLVPTLPYGPATEFEIGDGSFTAMELNQRSGGQQDFPSDDVDSLVDDVMEGIEDEGYL